MDDIKDKRTDNTDIADAETAKSADNVKNENLSPEERKKQIRGFIIETVCYIVFTVLFITLVPKYVMGRVSVDGNSMCNTLNDRDQLIGEKLSKRHGTLKRFDIIYFHPNGRTDVEPYIKRIIGMPGEKVEIIEGIIYINDMPLSENFAAEKEYYKKGDMEGPVYLKGDEYFVMGDNRNHSTDSRFLSVGPVKFKDIEGRAVFRLWPLSRFGKID